MGLDLWFRDDVRRILDALAAAGDERGPEYHKALADVAIAFGVERQGEGGEWVHHSPSVQYIDAER